jgi:hypothetical protein
MEIPSGVYIVQGHFCEHSQSGLNELTDRAFITANCGQEICLNLIVPNFISCITGVINPFIMAATRLGINEEQIKLTTATLLAAAKLPREMAIQDFETRKAGAKEAKSIEMVKIYDNALKVLKDLPITR